MKTHIECLPCFLEQTLRAAGMVTSDFKVLKKIADEVMCYLLHRKSMDASPAEVVSEGYKIVARITKVKDPYKEQKKYYKKTVLKIYPRLQQIVKKADDKLYTAIRLAATGNFLDLGAEDGYNVETAVNGLLNASYGIDDSSQLMEMIHSAKRILYLADNAGEEIFDKPLLIQLHKLGKEVIFAVKGGPIINDVTREDIEGLNIERYARVIDNGNDMCGTILKLCSDEFLNYFHHSDLIISKGQANFESLEEAPGNIFFIFKGKCPLMGRYLGTETGSMVIMKAGHRGG